MTEQNTEKQNNQSKADRYIIDIISAALEKNSERVELIALTFAKAIQKLNPTTASQIKEVISNYSTRGASLRGANGAPIPVDPDTHHEMVTLISPSIDASPTPILSTLIMDRLQSFLEERKKINLLLEQNLKPSTSLLLIGPPGTGKTMIAHFLASQLNKELVVLDLASSISSLMGKTGHNLKKVLNYAKQTASILLLDEFDAIAKKRDDNTDLGEIKRVVNVLLMELENWPSSSIIIATSNHPELLDRAVWRRFDHVIEVNIPEIEQREQLLRDELTNLLPNSQLSDILLPLAELLQNRSAADICRYANNVKRRIVLKQEEPITACLYELELYINDKSLRGRFCLLAKNALGDKITVRELSKITGLSSTAVQHHITKSKQNGKE